MLAGPKHDFGDFIEVVCKPTILELLIEAKHVLNNRGLHQRHEY